jgi:hypothetical protein
MEHGAGGGGTDGRPRVRLQPGRRWHDGRAGVATAGLETRLLIVTEVNGRIVALEVDAIRERWRSYAGAAVLRARIFRHDDPAW